MGLAHESGVAPLHPATVLVAEDHGPQRKMLARLLEQHGYNVVLAHDGEEALELWALHADMVRAVVADIDMPRLNGVELAQALRSRQADLPIVLTSGRAEPAASAADAFLNKPYEAERLLDLLEQLLTPSSSPRWQSA